MALIIPVGFAHAVYELSLDADTEGMVVTCGHDVSAVVGGDYGEIADRLHIGFGAEMMGIMSNLYTLTGVSLYVGQDGGPPAVFESGEEPVGGDVASAALPQNCAYLMRKRTSAAGRRGRGRMYLPGVPEGNVSAQGAIDGTWLDAIQTNAVAWYELLTGVPAGSVAYPPVILHRSEGIGTEPPPTPVTTFVFESVIATQRQRLRP